MRRRQTPARRVNHDRWIISYADFVTLLFAFFVVLFATATSDRQKIQAVSESVRAAFDQGKMSNVGLAIKQILVHDGNSTSHSSELPGSAGRANKPQKDETTGIAASGPAEVELTSSLNLLEKELHKEIEQGDVTLRMEPRGLAISFKQAAIFDSGQAVVKDSAYVAIQKVAHAISLIPNQIRLEGNTDNIPIHNEQFQSNWELSTSRSIAILNLLVDRFSVPKGRLGVAGYADVAPIATNDTEAGRAQNRRVDVVILSEVAGKAEPGKEARQ
jgi:chemotaxis protein MotB